MNKNQVKGQMHQTKGKAKEVVGKAVGNEKLEREGKLENAGGKVEKAYGDLKKSVKKSAK